MLKFLEGSFNKIKSLTHSSSSHRFWNLYNLQEEEVDLMVSPEKKLFTSLIEYADPDKTTADFIEKEANLKLGGNEALKKDKLFEKTKNFQLKRKDYLDFMKENPNGRVNIFEYNSSKITLVGAQYEFLPIKNIFHLLNYSKPDVVLLQVKPDQILKNFKLLLKSEKTQQFSNSKYFSQCIRKPEEIMPSVQHCKRVMSHLEKNRIYVSKHPKTFENLYKSYEIQDRLSMDAIATACYYCEVNSIPLILCDVPELAFRQDFLNSKTLMQVQNIFTRCSRELALYPDLQPQTPLNAGYYVYPELFLEKSDKYIATLINYILKPKGFKGKNIFALLGYLQSDSVASYLNSRTPSNFDLELTSPEPVNNFIREVTSEEVLEKHAIFDVMQQGIFVLQEFENLEFPMTYKIIEKYADPFKVNDKKHQEFRILHYEFLKKYQHFCQKEFEEGKQILKREFLKQTRII